MIIVSFRVEKLPFQGEKTKKIRTQDDRDYLKFLGTLVYDYEQQHEKMPTLKGIALFQALLEESELQPKDLVAILESESIVLDVLNGKRKLTEKEIQDLAVFFKINSSYFFE